MSILEAISLAAFIITKLIPILEEIFSKPQAGADRKVTLMGTVQASVPPEHWSLVQPISSDLIDKSVAANNQVKLLKKGDVS